MATAYPVFTSASTGLTTWSDGSTSSVSNPTPTKATNQTASVSLSSLSNILAELSRTLSSLMGKSSGGGMEFPLGEGLSREQQDAVNKSLGTYFGSTGKNYVTQPIQGPVMVANTGIASKQAQPVLNAQGQPITGAYAKSSGGSYYSVPMQSLGYSAGMTTGSLDKVRNIQKAGNNFNLQLNEAKSSAWDSNLTKQEKTKSIMESVAGEFGKNFNSEDDLNISYNTNPTIKTVLDNFISQGGTLEQIASKIQANQVSQNQPYIIQQGDTLSGIANRTGKSIQELMSLNPQITNPNLIRAGETLNLGAKIQDSASYLAEMRKPYITNPEALLKLPQDKLIENEIMRQANIPQQWRDYYLGTPEKMGVFELEKAQKQAQLDLIQEKLEDDKRAYREKARLQIDKTRAEMDIALAETETNRLKAKNYMTGLLAKLGALNTTGASGEALVKLDQKYEENKQNIKTKYNLAIREMEIEMNEGIESIENGYADKANKIKEDLTKSAMDITKELMKLDIESQSKLYSLTSSYAKLLKTQQDKYIAEQKKNQQNYVNTFGSIIGYNPNTIYPTRKITTGGVTTPTTTSTGSLISRLEAMLK